MLLAVMLLYVGAVLLVNGIWLVGQARAAEPAPAGGAAAASNDSILLENREVTVLNLFAGFVGLVTASTLLIQGNKAGDLASVRGGGFILLFAFTYLWVALNTFLNGAAARSAGTACSSPSRRSPPPTTRSRTPPATTRRSGSASTGSPGRVLWFLFFMLLALDRPVARITGIVAIVEGIATAWIFGFLLLEGAIAFG